MSQETRVMDSVLGEPFLFAIQDIKKIGCELDNNNSLWIR